MGSEANVEDFENEVGRLVDQARQLLIQENLRIKRMSASHGGGVSSRVYILMKEAVGKFHAQAVEKVIDELHTFSEQTSVPANELRQVVVRAFQTLGQYFMAVDLERYGSLLSNKALIGADKDYAGELRAAAMERLRRFDIGLWHQPAKERATVNNTIHAQTISGPIQQGTHHSSQTVQTRFDMAATLELIGKLEAELPSSDGNSDIADLRAEIDTLRSQLRKSSPNASILREAGSSVRTMAEAIGAAALTPAAIGAAHALGAALSAI